MATLVSRFDSSSNRFRGAWGSVCVAFLTLPIFTNENKVDDRIMIQICLFVGKAETATWFLSFTKINHLTAPLEISLSDDIVKVIKGGWHSLHTSIPEVTKDT